MDSDDLCFGSMAGDAPSEMMTEAGIFKLLIPKKTAPAVRATAMNK